MEKEFVPYEITLLPTDKPSRLYEFGGQIILTNEPTVAFRNQNIYITSDEEIKDGDSFYDDEEDEVLKAGKNVELHLVNNLKHNFKKIILTTDGDLIQDGIQSIDDDFLEWFVKNPSCEEVDIRKEMYIEYKKLSLKRTILPQSNGKISDGKITHELSLDLSQNTIPYYKIIIPQIKCYCGHTTYCDCLPIEEPKDVVLGYKTSLDAQMLDRIEPKQETLEEAAKDFVLSHDFSAITTQNHLANRCFQFGAEWQAEQILQFLYSEITERRPYSSSKMCEKVIEFIETIKR